MMFEDSTCLYPYSHISPVSMRGKGNETHLLLRQHHCYLIGNTRKIHSKSMQKQVYAGPMSAVNNRKRQLAGEQAGGHPGPVRPFQL